MADRFAAARGPARLRSRSDAQRAAAAADSRALAAPTAAWRSCTCSHRSTRRRSPTLWRRRR